MLIADKPRRPCTQFAATFSPIEATDGQAYSDDNFAR